MPARGKVEAAAWANAKQVFELFGLSKGMLTKLARNGQIKSALIKSRENARKGVRLFNVQSIRDLLEASVS
jgi:hypothetical protein